MKSKAICPEFFICKISVTCMHSRIHYFLEGWCSDTPRYLKGGCQKSPCPKCTKIK